MKELSIVYQNADYSLQYKTESKKHYLSTDIINITHYEVFFEDERLKDQFGNPFDFSTQSAKKKSEILLPHDSASLHLADVIIKAIAKEELL